MYCKKCGKELDTSAKFCPQCGAYMLQGENEDAVSAKPGQSTAKSQKKNGIIAFCVAVAVLLIAFILFRRYQENKLIYSMTDQLQSHHEEWIEKTYASYYDNIVYQTTYSDISLKRNGLMSYTMVYPLEILPWDSSKGEGTAPPVYVTITAEITTDPLLLTYSCDSIADAELPWPITLISTASFKGYNTGRMY